jgi:TatD DNase family protein
MLFPLYGRREGVRLALGLHPLEVSRIDISRELDLFRRFADHTSYIGEVGLDFSREGKASQQVQERVFDSILAISNMSEKFLTIHSRGAAKPVIDRLRLVGARRAVMHWFTGSAKDLEAGLDAGLFFSINPSMTRSIRGKALISRLPRNRILAETDGPYVQVSRRVVEPREVWLVIDYLAKEWQLPREAVASQLEDNLRLLTDSL